MAVKLLSRDVAHKSDIGGVVLDVASPEAAVAAARGDRGAAARRRCRRPGSTASCCSRWCARPEAQELILGVGRDAMFGPVILFGAGGVAVEVTRDTAVALPPLDAGLAAELVARTRVGRLLAGFRGRPPADAAALQGALIALSHLVEDFPCLRALDVNPLVADAAGVLALDVHDRDRSGRRRRGGGRIPDLAIRPYPAAWRETLARPEGDYALRPVRPADALLYPEFLARIDAEDIRMRFMAPRRHFPEEMALRLTQLDYDREMAFVALAPGRRRWPGCRASSAIRTTGAAEYSLLVRSRPAGARAGLGADAAS